MTPEFIVWDTIKEPKSGYFIEYVPPRSDMWLATLAVVIVGAQTHSAIAAILEAEFQQWAKRYPVPLMASAFNDTEDLINLSDVRPYNHLCGYYDQAAENLVMEWRSMDNEEFPESLKQENHLKRAYAGLSQRSQQQIKLEMELRAQQMRYAKRMLIFLSFIWLLVVPAIIEFLGEKYTWFATLLLFIIFGKATLKWLRLAGYMKQSAKEKREAEKQLKMNHYFYHCEKNPEGFMKLKAENFDRDTKERVLKEMTSL